MIRADGRITMLAVFVELEDGTKISISANGRQVEGASYQSYATMLDGHLVDGTIRIDGLQGYDTQLDVVGIGAVKIPPEMDASIVALRQSNDGTALTSTTHKD